VRGRGLSSERSDLLFSSQINRKAGRRWTQRAAFWRAEMRTADPSLRSGWQL